VIHIICCQLRYKKIPAHEVRSPSLQRTCNRSRDPSRLSASYTNIQATTRHLFHSKLSLSIVDLVTDWNSRPFFRPDANESKHPPTCPAQDQPSSLLFHDTFNDNNETPQPTKTPHDHNQCNLDYLHSARAFMSVINGKKEVQITNEIKEPSCHAVQSTQVSTCQKGAIKITDEWKSTMLYRNPLASIVNEYSGLRRPTKNMLQNLPPLTDYHRQLPVPLSNLLSRRDQASSLQPLPSPA